MNTDYDIDTINITFKFLEKQIKLLNFLKMKSFNTREFINVSKCNNLVGLQKYSNSAGVYIFCDKNNNPIYIGLAGKINGSHSLKDRLGVQLNCNLSNATLYKNIIKKNNLDRLDNIKTILINYAPIFYIIEVGEINRENVRTTHLLESFLIATYDTKYNL